MVSAHMYNWIANSGFRSVISRVNNCLTIYYKLSVLYTIVYKDLEKNYYLLYYTLYINIWAHNAKHHHYIGVRDRANIYNWKCVYTKTNIMGPEKVVSYTPLCVNRWIINIPWYENTRIIICISSSSWMWCSCDISIEHLFDTVLLFTTIAPRIGKVVQVYSHCFCCLFFFS